MGFLIGYAYELKITRRKIFMKLINILPSMVMFNL